jgi:hypothetical protein
MQEFRKNVIVGIFVLAAMLSLGAMILLLGKAPQWLSSMYTINIYFPSAGPVQNGDSVIMNGVRVGQVKLIRALPDVRKGVQVEAEIYSEYRIPKDVKPLIKEQSVGFGKSAIRIDVGSENSDQMLPTDGKGVLHGTVAGGIAELVPQATLQKLEDAGVALTNLATALKPVADDLHELLKPTSVAALDSTTAPKHPLANLSTAIQRLDTSLKGFNKIMADPNNQENIAVMVKNFRLVSENGVVLSKGLVTSTDKMSLLLDKLNVMGEKMNNGQGAAAKFLNDPELYEALTLTAKRLEMAIQDLQTLVRQWQEKGLKIEGGVLGK